MTRVSHASRQPVSPGGGYKLRQQDGAGLLAAGKARARSISEWICNERATTQAANRTSQVAALICFRLRK